jgi:hypothetical protein
MVLWRHGWGSDCVWGCFLITVGFENVESRTDKPKKSIEVSGSDL